MKISKLLPGLILPFLMFILFGSICTTSEDEDLKICAPTKESQRKVFRLKDGQVKMVKFNSPYANTDCGAYFLVKFGWEDETTQQALKTLSPIEQSFGGLTLKFGETAYNNVYHLTQLVGEESGMNPDGKMGSVWIIKSPVSPPNSSSSGSASTVFYVEMKHNILDEDFNIWVDVSIEYSYAQ